MLGPFVHCRSGPTAFLNDDVAYLLPIEAELVDAKPADPEENFFGIFTGTKWAQPKVDELVRLLRHVYLLREEAAAKGAAARAHMQRHFTPARLAEIVGAELKRLQAVVAERRRVGKASWIV